SGVWGASARDGAATSASDIGQTVRHNRVDSGPRPDHRGCLISVLPSLNDAASAASSPGATEATTGTGAIRRQGLAKHVFVTGGVASSLGKGLTASSLGRLLKSRGLRVTMQKLDPYINVDPGTMNPFQHGEVFVTDDKG